ncbi:tRNA (adenosine(37)-N6)-threonylcarbamoyltransferase complex dimerization subunit type 1 TsaB [Pseudooceanicola onchidii]|uniref:tRNA (adenosine(37)-N6)-threonylcarbamoyltransferase complex dimerization subunit type 1 TsaB n=1 Tax=Pseudooceanicola onchidii TaxID=2562279 RepID=UPI0010AAE7BD|nr:tRNA (adenosine(37)-N6)-threonylcarbamoyltransferase complex dimerization subunit type 1 TsaB [Pseudooceanicola onchidii]
MRSEPLTLGFDTSAAHCAAALLSGDRVIAARTEEMTRGQAERLFPLLEEVLTEGGATWADLSRIGVGTGPGNFTGIRIAVSAARGLGLSLKVPVLGVTSFEALALDLPGGTIATVAAPRDRIYVQTGGDDPRLIALETLEDEGLPRGATWVGAPADDCADRLAGQATAPRHPLAEAIARIAARKTPGPAPAPLYLRPADAAPARDTPPVIVP